MCRRRTIDRVVKLTVLVSILTGIVLYLTNAGKRLFQEETVHDRGTGKFRIIGNLLENCLLENYLFVFGKLEMLESLFDTSGDVLVEMHSCFHANCAMIR